MKTLILKWLRWRYGGNVYALKPPLGYHAKYAPKPLWWVALYRLRHTWWKCEVALFQKLGEPMRQAWLGE